MKKTYRIAVCEDNSSHLARINSYLKNIKSKYNAIDLEWSSISFSDIIEKQILDSSNFDLLILDLVEGATQEWKGEECLTIINNSTSKIKTIIYTGGGDRQQQNIYKYETYDFVISFVEKGDIEGIRLKEVIENELFINIDSVYELYNNDDIFLKSDIRSIGDSYFNQILIKIALDVGLTSNFVIHRMASGLSGAAVFKLEYEGKIDILKISKEIDKLKIEHENARGYYELFPDQITTRIRSTYYESQDKKALAILIKEVVDAKTLFSFIGSGDRSSIENALQSLFLDDYGLKRHYLNNRKGLGNWTFIFNKFDRLKFTLVERAYEELKLLISEYSEFNFSQIKNFILNQSYESLDKTKLLSPNFTKSLVLCHGDLHAKNILIQGKRPIIIDTGGIGYDYWCIDICRLIVNLFINGIDANSKDFFDIHLIKSNVLLANLILKQIELPFDGKNDCFIFSINWLISHCQDIYADLFTKFEFQLGLMKEFLQVSYRVGTVPPNRRAIAMVLAYNCMIEANLSISD